MNAPYKIYQIKDIANCDYAFRDFDKNKFNMNDYELIYSSDFFSESFMSDMEILEDLYYLFNINIPIDFEGRSLSISDIVEINNTKYYCGHIGWEPINI